MQPQDGGFSRALGREDEMLCEAEARGCFGAGSGGKAQPGCELVELPEILGGSPTSQACGGDLEMKRGSLCPPSKGLLPSQTLTLPQSPQRELIYLVTPDCHHSHSTIPKCQGDSLLGESPLAPCCCQAGFSGFLVVGEGMLGPLGWPLILGWWDFDLGVRDQLT